MINDPLDKAIRGECLVGLWLPCCGKQMIWAAIIKAI